MPSVHLESDDGVSIRLVDIDTVDAQVTTRIAEVAALGPPIIAAPTGAQFGLGSIQSRTDFADDEIEALHDILGQVLDVDDDCTQSAYGTDTLTPVEFTHLAVRVDGQLVGRFPLGEAAWWQECPECGSFHTEIFSEAHIGRGYRLRCFDCDHRWDEPEASHGELEDLHDAGDFRFNPMQRRAPKGSPIGGRWIDDAPATGAIVPERNPARTPDQELWRQRSNRARAGMTILPTRADRDTKAGKLYGKGSELNVDESLDMLFPEGALTAPIPFRTASRTRGEPMFDRALVNETLAAERVLRPVDPRVLHATQPGLRRDAVRYYLGQEYRQIGVTFADQGDRGNIHPVVYKSPKGQWVLLSGHHRAAAALLRGEPLDAIVIDPAAGPPPRRVGTDIPTRQQRAANARAARSRRQLTVAGRATLEGIHVS